MNTKHTPGPWFYTTEGKNALGLVEKDGTNIMHMATLENSTAASSMEANARLIAAAPDLLDLAKAQDLLISMLYTHSLSHPEALKAEDKVRKLGGAIAKATGG